MYNNFDVISLDNDRYLDLIYGDLYGYERPRSMPDIIDDEDYFDFDAELDYSRVFGDDCPPILYPTSDDEDYDNDYHPEIEEPEQEEIDYTRPFDGDFHDDDLPF